MAKQAKKKKKKSTSHSTHRGEKLMTFLKGDDFARIRGVFYLLFAAFIFVAILSYFCTGQDAGKERHWLGSLGFYCADFFVKKIFGIVSIGFSLIFTSLGFYVFRHVRMHRNYEEGKNWRKKPLLPLGKTVMFSLFWMAWLSCSIGYVEVIKEFSGSLSGTFGYSFASLLNNIMKIFTPVLLLAGAGVMLVVVHHIKVPNISLPKRTPKPVDEIEEIEEPEEESEEEETKENIFKRLFSKFKASQEEEEEPGDEPQPQPKKESKLRIGKTIIPKDIQEEEVSETESGSIKFDINDEFARINARAQGKTEPETVVAEPTFTLNIPETEDEEDVVNEEISSAAEGEPEQRLTVENGQLIDVTTGEPLPPYDPHLDLKDYQMPTLEILENWEEKNVKVTKEELIANKDRIVKTLRDYGIEIVEISASPGPTVTLYEIKPAPGVRISKIKSLEDDIALSLAALGIRIIAPIPGKSAVGIEVPNAKPQIVSMKTMLSSDAFQNAKKMELPIALGKTISNEPYVTDLAKMPHLLMAGATGTGKSVGLNAIISSLLYKKHPSELKFVMVDPKKVELSLYSKIERHYLAKMPDETDAIITDVKKVVRTLNSLCIEMDQRYDLLKMAQVRKITEYNDKFKRRMLNPENGHRFLPYIVLVIDEFADLIMTAGKEVETPICRLAQLARAVGIHLIIATQRPTTNIITGTIKTNFPARIAFRVTSAIDSRTILDTGGANQLIGRGDMLISLAGSDMVRIQCALIETEEIEKLGDRIGEQRGYPEGFLLPEYLDENEEPNKDFDPKQKDNMFDEAARLVVASQFGSTSLLQRKLQLGYNRAGRIMDQLEAAGIVGPYNGSKAREVLIKDELSLEDILSSL